MTGPGTAWYLGIAAFLFGTGALGVLIRRNLLIVLLSLEIMLNGANLALIAFSRHAGNGAGQIFALAVMAVAASEVCVGLGLVVAINRKKLALDVDRFMRRLGLHRAAPVPLPDGGELRLSGLRLGAKQLRVSERVKSAPGERRLRQRAIGAVHV